MSHFSWHVLGVDSYDRPPLEVAGLLLNKILFHRGRVGRIVEVEAYGGADDPASHAARAMTPRNASMFKGPGHLYVYKSYGVHNCANVVCLGRGQPAAVLLRALEVMQSTSNVQTKTEATKAPNRICAGPGRLCAALEISLDLDGVDLVQSKEITIFDDGTPPPLDPWRGPRIGLGKRAQCAKSWPWRLGVPGSTSLSRPFV